MMKRNVCIHGHFYQPPRENPWLEKIELQDSAFPYHDWNKKITAECYAPCAASRILDHERKIIDIVNLYSKISFNFGPTLLSWMERNEPGTYQAVLSADKESQQRFSGHGSALAQCYNHMIMPLSNRADKETQIIWGIRDFEFRFKRKPEGMWLPETAVDIESLDILAEHGIKFTILAQHQAARFRKISSQKWHDTKKAAIDPKMAYLCNLPSGRSIALFFYDGPISNEVAFGRMLRNGQNFANQIMQAFRTQDKNELVSIATDGETYGHHHLFGDMALAYCLYHIESNNLAKITNYAEFLEKNHPHHEVEIVENSSWSCIHGIERWRADCGCATSGSDWNQKWRTPLREAMDWLRDNLIKIYQDQMSKYVQNVWQLRNDYIAVILNREIQNVEAFISKQAQRELSKQEKQHFLKLLEMQRNAMYMYTSCGWFFDDISGIEAIQVMEYASRAIQLASQVSDQNLEEGFLNLLVKAKSNITAYFDGAQIYKQFIKPKALDLKRVGAHYAVSSLFEKYPEKMNIYCFSTSSINYDRIESGRHKIAVGNVHIQSNITWEEKTLSFAVLHLGDHSIFGGVSEYRDDITFTKMSEEIREIFSKGDMHRTILLIEKYFVDHNYSLWYLFKDEQRKILNQILDKTISEVETSLKQIKEHHYQTMLAVRELGAPLPRTIAAVVEVILNSELEKTLGLEEFDVNRFNQVYEEIKKWGFKIERPDFEYAASSQVSKIMKQLERDPRNILLLEKVESLLKMLASTPLKLNLWMAQNIYFFIGKQIFNSLKQKQEQGDEDAAKWTDYFHKLGDHLKVKVDF